MKKSVSLLLAGVMMSSSGCSLFQPRQVPVAITTSEPGADVFVNGRPVGRGPLTVMLDRDHNYVITATANGRTGSEGLGREISITGILDIVGTFFFIVPVIGVFTPGFWDLDSDVVHVQIPNYGPPPGYMQVPYAPPPQGQQYAPPPGQYAPVPTPPGPSVPVPPAPPQ